MSQPYGTRRKFSYQQRQVIAAALRQRQDELQLSKLEAANRLKMGYSTYCNLQDGNKKSPSYSHQNRVKVALGYGWVSNWPEVIVGGGDPMFRSDTTGQLPLGNPVEPVEPVVNVAPQVEPAKAIDANVVTANLSTAILAMLNGNTTEASLLVAQALQHLTHAQTPKATVPVFTMPAPKPTAQIATEAVTESVADDNREGRIRPALRGERLERFNADARSGMTSSQLGLKYGIAISTAERYSAKARGTWQSRSQRKYATPEDNGGGRPPALTGSALARFNADALARKKTLRQLATDYGISQQTAYIYAQRVRSQQEQSATEAVASTLV